MKVKDVIEKIYSPKGVTSIINGLLSGDFSVLNNQKGIETSLEKAEEMIIKYQKDLDECKSEWSYWSILGDLIYWKVIKNILKAGDLNNGELANVPIPNLEDCVLMDCLSKLEKFGETVLEETRKLIKR